MSTTSINIDLAALEAEVGNLSEEEIKKQMVDIRTRQIVQQTKNKDSQRAYMKKRAEMVKLMTKKAKEMGIYDAITQEAKVKAATKLNEIADSEGANDEPEEEAAA